LLLLLAGCGSGGVALSLAIVGTSIYQASDFSMSPSPSVAYEPDRRPPPMAPDRKVNEVDCSQPIDWSLGNIRCK
jgi:hypothetical protein